MKQDPKDDTDLCRAVPEDVVLILLARPLTKLGERGQRLPDDIGVVLRDTKAENNDCGPAHATQKPNGLPDKIE